MDKQTKLTLEEVLRRKEQILEAKKQRKRCDLYIDSLGGIITIAEPRKGIISDAKGMDDDNEANKFVVYDCVVEPNLKNQKLQTEFNCGEPTDIVDIFFKEGEIAQIATKAMELAGYMKGSVQELKNE